MPIKLARIRSLNRSATESPPTRYYGWVAGGSRGSASNGWIESGTDLGVASGATYAAGIAVAGFASDGVADCGAGAAPNSGAGRLSPAGMGSGCSSFGGVISRISSGWISSKRGWTGDSCNCAESPTCCA